MKEILVLLKSIRARNIKIKSMREVYFKYINTDYTLIYNPSTIDIKLGALTFSFDRTDGIELIKDFLNM